MRLQGRPRQPWQRLCNSRHRARGVHQNNNILYLFLRYRTPRDALELSEVHVAATASSTRLSAAVTWAASFSTNMMPT